MMKSILIVDDNRFLRHQLRSVLEREADFQVCGEAENGRQAIEMAQRLRPDLIILDLAMPVMNGFEAAQVLKRSMPDISIILLSNYSSVFSEQEAHSAGIAALVEKSESVSVLISKARELLYSVAA
jgi:DNA-binding NarL/FixJ family response regulator